MNRGGVDSTGRAEVEDLKFETGEREDRLKAGLQREFDL